VKDLPEVVSVRVCGDTSLEVTFDDGVERRVNVRRFLRGPILEKLRLPAFFRKAKLSRAAGTVVWPNGADIAPETLYEMPEERVPTRARPRGRGAAGKPRAGAPRGGAESGGAPTGSRCAGWRRM
jgi:hypothetical protein